MDDWPTARAHRIGRCARSSPQSSTCHGSRRAGSPGARRPAYRCPDQLATARTSGDTTGLSRRTGGAIGSGSRNRWGKAELGELPTISSSSSSPHLLCACALAPSGQRQSRARCPVTGGSYVSASIRLCLVTTRLTSKLRKGHNNANC